MSLLRGFSEIKSAPCTYGVGFSTKHSLVNLTDLMFVSYLCHLCNDYAPENSTTRQARECRPVVPGVMAGVVPV